MSFVAWLCPFTPQALPCFITTMGWRVLHLPVISYWLDFIAFYRLHLAGVRCSVFPCLTYAFSRLLWPEVQLLSMIGGLSTLFISDLRQSWHWELPWPFTFLSWDRWQSFLCSVVRAVQTQVPMMSRHGRFMAARLLYQPFYRSMFRRLHRASYHESLSLFITACRSISLSAQPIFCVFGDFTRWFGNIVQ